MKAFTLLFSITLTALVLCGCASHPTSTYVLVGTQRPAIDPAQVKLYIRPPAKYEEVALVSADSKHAGARGAQAKMDAAVQRLKVEAAKLGANGIILSGVGDRYAGSVGYGFGSATAYGTGSSVTAYGAGSTVSAPVYIKTASGTAIFVTQE
jgi:hypothetical protein